MVPVYVLCAATVAVLVRQAGLRTSPAQRRAAWLLVTVIVAQGIIGYTQHFTGLPLGLVWAHMLGSALTMVAAANLWDRYQAPFITRSPYSSTASPESSKTSMVPE